MRHASHFLLLSLTLAGCARNVVVRTPEPVPGALAEERTYLDLAPGWRLRIITPLLKGSGPIYKEASREQQGGTVSLTTTENFLGYETSYYEVLKNGRIRFASVSATVDGKTEPRSKPLQRMFQLPRDARFVRIVFLTRSTAADHDMAVLSAPTRVRLNEWTPKLKADPVAACSAIRYCTFIPAGVAVTAEKPSATGNWTPAD